MEPEKLAKYFDHTILKPDATKDEVERICTEAQDFGFFSVCVNPIHVKWVSKILTGSKVKVCSVVGFPLGTHTAAIKAAETKLAIADGADEIDMVINIGALLDNDHTTIEGEICEVVEAADGKIVKVIIETCLLNEDQKINACGLVKKAGAQFVKTSTGFSGGGATIEDVELMKKNVGDCLKIKASGGVKTVQDALDMIAAGADRIGASAGVDIMKALL